jgi:hypothetical protein
VAVAARLRQPVWQQHGIICVSTAAGIAAAAWWRQQRQHGGGQRVGSAMASGMAVVAAATAVLPLHAVVVAMKSPAARVMAGAHTKINNQLKSATATADGRVAGRISII